MPDILLWRNTHQIILKFFDPAVPDFHCKRSQTAGSGSESFSYHTGFHLSLKPLCCFRLKSKHRDLPICYKNKRCGIVPLRKPEFYAFLHYNMIIWKEKVEIHFPPWKLHRFLLRKRGWREIDWTATILSLCGTDTLSLVFVECHKCSFKSEFLSESLDSATLDFWPHPLYVI